VSGLTFEVLDARVEPYAAQPTLMLRLRLSETTGTPVHAVALRCQLKIEPQRRHYEDGEVTRLYDIFGEPRQWGDSLRPFLWDHLGAVVPGFEGSTDVDLPVTCTYDLEVAAAKYLHALAGGDVPLILLFSGTVFSRGPSGLTIEPIPWDSEATFRLPVATWRGVMDRFFPDSGWLRASHETLARLQQFRAERGLTSMDEALQHLFKEAGVEDW